MHVATATAPGSAHVNPGREGKKNNQDVIVRREHARGSVIVLCDGCGSQPYSGTGADIGANIIARVICDRLAKGQFNWATLTDDVVAALRGAISAFAADGSVAAFEATVQERFLFTAMVVVTMNNAAVVAAFGDGVVIIDDEVITLQPPIPDAPPYIGYLLVAENGYNTRKLRQHLAFKIVKAVDVSTLKKGLVVGTDGLKDLVGEDFSHPALVEAQLLQGWLNNQTVERVREGALVAGRCSDDVSLVLVRSEATQQRLLEGRREIVGLKEEVARLKVSVAAVNNQLNQAALERQSADRQIDQLKRQLEWAKNRAEKTYQLEQEVASLKSRLAEMRMNRIAQLRGAKEQPKEKEGGTLLGTVFGFLRPKQESDSEQEHLPDVPYRRNDADKK